MQHIDPPIKAFVERWGLTMESMGASRTFGRMLGLLLIAERPLSLDDLVRLLHVSKASVSTNGRMLEQMGMAERVGLPGDRRTYYAISSGSFEHSTAIRLRAIEQMLDLTRDGLEAIDAGNDTARERLEQMQAFYTFMDREMIGALDRWKQMQRGDGAEDD